MSVTASAVLVRRSRNSTGSNIGFKRINIKPCSRESYRIGPPCGRQCSHTCKLCAFSPPIESDSNRSSMDHLSSDKCSALHLWSTFPTHRKSRSHRQIGPTSKGGCFFSQPVFVFRRSFSDSYAFFQAPRIGRALLHAYGNFQLPTCICRQIAFPHGFAASEFTANIYILN